MNIRKSYSEISTYKQCRKKYYFSYVENLRSTTKSEPLVMGSSYHKKLEQIIKDGDFEKTNDKTDVMASVWEKHIYPQLDIVESEKYFDTEITKDLNIVGYVDGVCRNGWQIEHKTTSTKIDEAYIHKLAWDDQIPIYMLANNSRDMWYTVIQKPSIRQKQNESYESYLTRCEEWYEDGTETKIALFAVHRTDADIAEKKKEVIDIACEIENCKLYYRNPSACSIYGCEFSSICLNYDPKFTIGFESKRGREEDGYTESE